MKTVWKFPLTSGLKVDMPKGAQILTVQMQGNTPTLWALVEQGAEKETRSFSVYGTGHPVPLDPGSYVSTIQDGPRVWHIFEDAR